MMERPRAGFGSTDGRSSTTIGVARGVRLRANPEESRLRPERRPMKMWEG